MVSNIVNLRYAGDTNLMAENKEELKSLLMKVKEENERADLRLNIEKANGNWPHYCMANRRGNVEVVTDFLFLGSRITADGDYSHEIRRLLLFGRKTMINLDSMLKNRHDSADQGLYSQGYGRPSGHIWL